MLADRQLFLVRGSGSWPIDVGEATTAGLIPSPDPWWRIGLVCHLLSPNANGCCQVSARALQRTLRRLRITQAQPRMLAKAAYCCQFGTAPSLASFRLVSYKHVSENHCSYHCPELGLRQRGP